MTDAAADRLPFFTIGHARHPLEEFARMLQGAGVTHLIDVRSFPRSRTNPQFNIDTLPQALQPFGISYEHIAILGGRRNLQKNVAPELNAFWDNRSFHNYADYTQQPAFREGLAQLVAAGRRERSAYMCSETVWWRCHRRIITDWLLARGETVFHILPEHVDAARLTRGAVAHPDGSVTYPALSGELWAPSDPPQHNPSPS
jgi:uncharacterized protein (DUF488 family)